MTLSASAASLVFRFAGPPVPPACRKTSAASKPALGSRSTGSWCNGPTAKGWNGGARFESMPLPWKVLSPIRWISSCCATRFESSPGGCAVWPDITRSSFRTQGRKRGQSPSAFYSESILGGDTAETLAQTFDQRPAVSWRRDPGTGRRSPRGANVAAATGFRRCVQVSMVIGTEYRRHSTDPLSGSDKPEI